LKTFSEDTYERLIALLDQHAVQYRLIEHAPEGRTELVSAMRGNTLSQAAKCIILMVKIGKKITRYILAVVPGDAKVDLQAIKALLKGTYVAFASSDIAESLAGSIAGTILPFSFNPELELVVDPSLLENDEIYFNAARLDRSLALKTSDYVALAKPRLGRVVGSQRA
jgi:Ala-tRNA(Pro) deacylase